MPGSTLPTGNTLTLAFSASQQASFASYYKAQNTNTVFTHAMQAFQKQDAADYNALVAIAQGKSITDTLTLSDTAQAYMTQDGLANLLSYGTASSGKLTAGYGSQSITVTLTSANQKALKTALGNKAMQSDLSAFQASDSADYNQLQALMSGAQTSITLSAAGQQALTAAGLNGILS
jgi:hypothetical protein